MCRLVAWATTKPVTLEQVIGAEQLETLREISHLHPDGWGAALRVEGSPVPRIHRSTMRAGADEDFLTVATSWSARAGLVHLRRATSGFAVLEENTHPFTVDGWAFAHNGGIPHAERIDRITSSSWRGRRRGDTDSERYFLALAERIEERGDLLEGIRTSVADIRRECGPASMNAILLGSGVLAVVHASAGARPPVADLLESVGGAQDRLPRGHLDRYYDLVFRHVAGGVVVSSTGMPDESWEQLQPESVLLFDLERSTFEIVPAEATAADASVGAGRRS